MTVTEAAAAAAFRKVRTAIATARHGQPIGLREIRIDAETFEVLEEWTRADCLALKQEYQGVEYAGVRVLPPFGYKPPEELGRG
jgi:hypothetical protein